MTRPNNEPKNDDRILVPKVKDGMKPMDTKGMFDPRLFTGENKLHAQRGLDNLWYLKYEMGSLPPPLQGHKYTHFKNLYQHAENYYAGRNIEISEIID